MQVAVIKLKFWIWAILVCMKFLINYVNIFPGIDLIPQVKIEDLKQMKVSIDTSFSGGAPNFLFK